MTAPRTVIETPCAVSSLARLDIIEHLDPAALVALGIDPHAPALQGSADEAPQEDREEPTLPPKTAQRLDNAIATCLASYEPRGVYKVFNPVTCTLPPRYTEPAIKLVGTMMMFKGQTVYERLRRALHCAIMAVTLGPENPQALPEHADDLDRAIADACAFALVERAADNVTASIVDAALEDGLYTDDRLCPGEGDFPVETRSQFVFYARTEKLLDLSIDAESQFVPRYSTVGVVGMLDPSQKNRKRACGRCKYRSFCSIRAIGMNCHGGKGSFDKSPSSK